MTVSTTNTRIAYTGNGSTTAFAFPYPFLSGTDLKVYKNGTLQTITTHYTVSGGAGSSGTVTFLTAPVSGNSIVILRDPTMTQLLDYIANDAFPAESHEQGLDRLTMISQRLADRMDRAMHLADFDVSGASTVMPTPEADNFVAWDSAGTALINVAASDLITVAASENKVVDTFVGANGDFTAGTTTTLPLTQAPGAEENVTITFDGVVQHHGTFSVSGTTITFSSAIPVGVAEVEAQYMRTLSVSTLASENASWTHSGIGAVERNVRNRLRDTVSVLDYISPAQHAAIIAGTSTFDCTSGIAAAFAAHSSVDFGYEGWLFNVSTFTVPAGKSLVTRGRGPTFQQIAGQLAGTRIIVVGGSNVTIGDCELVGNIDTDTGEQMLGILCQANATAGNIENVLIGNIRGRNIRGDVVYIGRSSSIYSLTNVHVGHISFDNVFRHGFTCAGGDGWSVKSVTGTRCGLFHVDIEANVGGGTCTNGRIGYVKGRHLGLNAQSAAEYIDDVEIGVLDLSPSHAAQSSQAYPSTYDDGLLLRNVRSASIKHLKLEGFNRSGIFTTYNVGELGCLLLKIGKLHMRNCSITDAVYNAYVVGAAVTRLEIDYVDVVITQSSKRAFSGVAGSTIKSTLADIRSSSTFFYDSSDTVLMNHEQTGANGFMLQASNRVTVIGGSFTGDRLTATGSSKCSFHNFTATAAVLLFPAGQEDHFVSNSTLNGDYYGWGTPIRSHLFTMRLGAYHLWVDATGDLRIKSSAPTSDTDGTVVGTQS